MKKIFSILSIISGFMVFGQIGMDFSGNKILENQWFKSVFKENIVDVQGSPYFNAAFHPAAVVGTTEQVMLRYNMYHDNLEFSKNDKIMVLPKDGYKSATFLVDNTKIDLLTDGYYFHIYQGKNLQLYRKNKVKFQKFEKAASGYVEDKPAKFVKLPDEYFLMMNGQLISVPKSQKAFANLFPGQSEDILKFLKQNKLKTTEESDLKAIMRHIDK